MPSNTRRGNCGADRLDLQQAIRCNASVSSHTSLSCNGLKSVHDESAGFYHLPPGFRLPVQIILPGLTVQPVGLCLQSSAGWLDNHRFFFPGPLKISLPFSSLKKKKLKRKPHVQIVRCFQVFRMKIFPNVLQQWIDCMLGRIAGGLSQYSPMASTCNCRESAMGKILT